MNISLTAYDDLFRSEEERQAEEMERVQLLPPGMFYPFPNHPFHIRDDEQMQQTIESVARVGVLSPILARPRPEGGYEIVSGHRRLHASKLAELEKIPAIIRDLSDDEATIIMVDSNLQREEILPSEKAFAYKMKLDAIKHQGQKTLDQVGPKWSNQEIGKCENDSMTQVKRYIRLTHLTEPLLTMVDEKQLAFNAAYEISYLPEEHQSLLLEAIDYAQTSPSLAQARKIRAFSASGKLDSNVLESILSEEKPLERKVTLKGDKLKKFFPESYTPLQMEKVIVNLLESWSRQQKERDNHAR